MEAVIKKEIEKEIEGSIENAVEGIGENQISNMQKHKNYRDNFTKLKRALELEFYYEAIFIEYSIIEDRTESILRHADKWEAYLKKHRRGNPLREPTIESKIKYINGQLESGNKLLIKYFSTDILTQILEWKEDRNKLIHALLNQSLTDEDLAQIAFRGDALTKDLRNRATAYSRAIQRQRKKESEK